MPSDEDPSTLTAGRALGAVHGALSTVFYAFLLRSFLIKWRAKDRFALTRIPELTVFTATASLLVIYVLDANLIWYQWYTYATALPIPFVYCSVAIPYMIRAVLLWYRFGLCEEMVSKEVHSKDQHNWFRKNRKYFQPRFVLKVAFFLTLFIVLIALFDLFFFKTDETYRIAVYSVLGIIFITITFVFMFKVRFKYDAWNIRKELQIVVALAVVVFFIVLILAVIHSSKDLIGGDPKLGPLIAFSLLFSLPFLLFMYISLYYVVRNKSTGNKEFSEKLEMNETVNNVEKFEELLEDTEFYQLFQKHLIKELSVEHLAFWSQICGFEQLTRNREASCTDITTYAQNIVETYITPSSQLEINISDVCRRKIVQNMEVLIKSQGEASRDIFSSAKTEILMLLARDSFIRFARTPEFLQFLEKRTAANLLSKPGVQIAHTDSHESFLRSGLISPKFTVTPFEHLRAELTKIRETPQIPVGKMEIKEV